MPNFIPIGFKTTEPYAFFEEGRPKKKNNNKNNNRMMSSDIKSVPGPKHGAVTQWHQSKFNIYFWEGRGKQWEMKRRSAERGI